MGDKQTKYPTKEEKIIDSGKNSDTYIPPEKYNVNKSNGDSNDDNRSDNSRATEGNA